VEQRKINYIVALQKRYDRNKMSDGIDQSQPPPATETPAYTSTSFDATMFQREANACAYIDSCGRCVAGYGELNVHDFSRYNDTLHEQFYKTCEQSAGTVETSDEKGVHCKYTDSGGNVPSPEELDSLRNGVDEHLRFNDIGAVGFDSIISSQISYCRKNNKNPIACANDLAERITFE
jgi:hypothetical protein